MGGEYVFLNRHLIILFSEIRLFKYARVKQGKDGIAMDLSFSGHLKLTYGPHWTSHPESCFSFCGPSL